MFWESDDTVSHMKRKTRSGVTFESEKSIRGKDISFKGFLFVVTLYALLCKLLNLIMKISLKISR